MILNPCTWRNLEQNKEDSQTNSSAKNTEGLFPFLCEMFKIKTSAIFAKWNSWIHLKKGNKRRWFLKELVTRIVEKSCPGGGSFSLNTWERAKCGHFLPISEKGKKTGWNIAQLCSAQAPTWSPAAAVYMPQINTYSKHGHKCLKENSRLVTKVTFEGKNKSQRDTMDTW